MQRLFERRIGFVIHLALFLASTGIILPLKFLQDSDKGLTLRYSGCFVPLWLALLGVHYAVPSLYQRIDPTHNEATSRYPHHFYRDIHSGLFFGLNSLAWVSLLSETWAVGASINGVTYAAVAWGWGCLIPIWIVVFVVHLRMVASQDKRIARSEMVRG